MADLFQLESGLTESSSPSGLSPASSTLSTGDLRRKYNFGDRVSELAIAQDPFFRFVSKVAKRPTDDPELLANPDQFITQKNYINTVAKAAGVSPVEPLDLTQTEPMASILAELSKVEKGAELAAQTDEILKASNAVIVSTPANPPRLAIP